MTEPNYKNNIEKMSVELWEIAIDVEEREKKLEDRLHLLL